MDTFDDLYCRSIVFLQTLTVGNYQSQGVGDITILDAIRNNHRVTAVMLISEDKSQIPPEDIKAGKAITLSEAIERRPRILEDGLMSWVVLRDEEQPSTIMIHKGINPDELKVMCYARLFRSIKGIDDEAFKKAREIAEDVTLTQPESPEKFLAHQRG